MQLERSAFLSPTPLRTPAKPVSNFDDALMELIQDLKDTIMANEVAIGLAAPQLGVYQRVAVVNLSRTVGKELVLVNPTITSNSGKRDVKKESCMSLPHYRGAVERRHKLVVEYQDQDGFPRTVAATGFLARAICHEVDHLDGLLYVDRMVAGSKLEEVDFF